MKRILALALTVLLIWGLLPTWAFADTNEPAFVLAGGKAQQGDTVQVTLSTKNNPGIVSLKVKIGYDKTKLSLTSMEGKDFADVTFGPVTKNPATVNWLNSLEPNNTVNGVVAVLTFQVLDSAVDGETAITATYAPEDVFDYNENNVFFQVVNGVVTVGCLHKETTTVPAKSSTCLEQGNGEYTYCNRCEEVLAGSDELLPLGDHTFTAQVVADEYKVSDATCVDKAVYLHSCTLCGVAGEVPFTVGGVDVKNHVGSTVTVPAQDSTCLEQGHNQYSYCDACKTVVEGSDELLPLGDHTFTAQVVADEYKVSDATCVDKAVYLHSCTLCGVAGEIPFTVGGVDKTNHVGNQVLVGEKEPSYEEEGYTGDLCCDACGDLLQEGTFIDKLVKENGLVQDGDVYRYLVDGEAQLGWFEIDGEWYYFFEDTLAAKEGSYQVGDVTYTFEQTGKLTSGVWASTLYGVRYYYGPSYYRNTWALIEDNWYYFEGGYRTTGYAYVPLKDSTQKGVCLFDEQGAFVETLKGISDLDGTLRYYENGVKKAAGLVLVDGFYYFADVDGKIATGKTYVWKGNGILPEDHYWFDERGKLVGAVVEDGQTLLGEIAADETGTLRYYQMGKATPAGLVLVDGYYYFADVNGVIATGESYVWKGNGILPEDTYLFREDGKMVGVKVENGETVLGEIATDETGVLRYYEMGKTTPAGLVLVDGFYYFADVGGVIRTGDAYVWKTNGIVPEDNYLFHADGKMVGVKVENGETVLGEIATDENGTLRYYQLGKAKPVGLVLVDGYYYFADVGGVIRTGDAYVWRPNDIVPEDSYLFHADGKMVGVKVENGETVLGEIATDENGTLRYYQLGKAKPVGLVLVDGHYYFADVGGVIRTGDAYVWKTNGIVPEDNYLFHADGKMVGVKVENGETVLGEIATDENGTLRYYQLGKAKPVGLVLVDGYYYFADVGGVIRTGDAYVWKTNGIVPEDNYLFHADGKMVGVKVVDGQTVLGGIVTDETGVLRYYQMGKAAPAGLVLVDGFYYFADVGGVIRTGKTYVWKGNGIVPEDNYLFHADGKMLGVKVVDGQTVLGEILNQEGTLLYYQWGSAVAAGFVMVDGDYYFADVDGKVAVGKTYVWKGNGLVAEGHYEFGADGKALDGFVTKEDGIYYYEMGACGTEGLHYIDGYYYCVGNDGKLLVNGSYYVWKTNGYSLPMTYTFDELGRIVL